MSAFSIPLPSGLFDYKFKVDLEEDTFNLRVRFNTRLASWFLDIFDRDNAPLVYGRRCVVETRLIGQSKHLDGISPGELTCFDTENLQRDATVDDLGTRVLLFYFDAADITEAVASVEA